MLNYIIKQRFRFRYVLREYSSLIPLQQHQNLSINKYIAIYIYDVDDDDDDDETGLTVT